MKLEFSIEGAAPTEAHIQAELVRMRRHEGIAGWVIVGLSLVMLASASVLVCPHYQSESWPALLGTGLIVGLIVVLVGGWRDPALCAVRQLQPLSQEHCGSMIALCAEHPALEAYRLKVIAQGRQFVVAEYAAAKNYDIECTLAAMRDRAAEREKVQAAADAAECRKLYSAEALKEVSQ